MNVVGRYFLGTGMAQWMDDNVGDKTLNSFLLPKLFPVLEQETTHPEAVILGIGSIYGIRQQCMPKTERELPVLVFGSGYQFGTATALPEKSKVFCVRGRYTAQQASLPETCAVADPAILLPLYLKRDTEAVKGRTGRVYPWYYDLSDKNNSFTDTLKNYTSLKYLQYRTTYNLWKLVPRHKLFTARCNYNLLQWLKKLWSCERIVTKAMHPAIIADTYGIPWKPLRWDPKWADHFGMLGIDKKPDSFVLSDRALLQKRISTLLERRDELLDFIADRR